MKSFLFRTWVFLGLALLLGGCATYSAQVERGRSLKGIQRFFVVSNLNDNHAINQLIAEALKAEGREAETGPLTMMPDNTQAIVTFQDHWAWDFGDHLVFLQVAIHDRRSEQSFATLTFSARIPLHKPPSEIVARIVDQLLNKE